MGLFSPSIIKIQTAAIFFAGWGAAFIFALVTLGLISIIASDSVFIEWSLWRIPDTIMVFVNLFVFLLYTTPTPSYKPVVVYLIFASGALFVDLASLIVFSVQYTSCLQDIINGEALIDPLCMTVDLKKVGAYHIAIIAALFLGSILTLYVAILLYRIRTYDQGQFKSLFTRVYYASYGANKRGIARAAILHRALSVFQLFLVIIIIEITALTPSTDIKYLWFVYVPGLITTFTSLSPFFLTNYRANLVLTFISLGSFIGGAGLGVGLMAWYYDWLCVTEPPKLGFSNFSACVFDHTQVIYFLVFHCLVTFTLLLRTFIYAYVTRVSQRLRDQSEAAVITETINNAESLTYYGGIHRRSNIATLVSETTGLPFYVEK